MSHPGRVGRDCASCGAELQEAGGGVLRCPWAPAMPLQVEAGEVACGRPYTRPDVDPARAYVRDQSRKKGHRP